MSLLSAKNLLYLFALFFLLLSCSREGSEPSWEPETYLGSKDYNGGIFPVWIKLKKSAQDANITWATGSHAQIAYRKQELNSRGEVVADTAFFHWETPPSVTVITECVKIDDKCEEIDIELYLDTVFAIVNGLKSDPIIIEVKNILPKVKSLSVGGLTQPGDSTLIIAAHPGDRLEVELRLEKTFNKTHSPRLELPLNMFGGSMRLLSSPSDSLYLWEWIVPNRTVDTIIHLKIWDTGGYGERLYKVHFISYDEFGSIWVASENEIAKFSPNGSRVLNIVDTNFRNISDIAVHSNTEKLFVIDQYKNFFAVYDTYGKQLYQNKDLLQNPTSIAVDIEGVYIWIADSSVVDSITTQSRFRLRAFDYITGAITKVDRLEFKDFSGAIRGLSTDKYDRTRLWFTLPETDTVGFVRYTNAGSNVEYIKPSRSNWNRPSMVSLNPDNELAWVADSSRIVAIRKDDGREMAIVDGFSFVSAVSASGNTVWASDNFKGKVYRFNGPFYGSPRDLALTIADGTEVDAGGFVQPEYVSTYIADGSAWVMDRGKGEIVRVNSSGRRIVAGTGLRPLIGKTIQKVE
jgi:hypothetical protein